MPDLSALPKLERTERQDALVESAAELAGDQNEASPLIGYVVLCFYGDGTTRTAGWHPKPSDHQLGASLFHSWTRDTLERHFVYREGREAAIDVLNDA
jgi:hypothetical protein